MTSTTMWSMPLLLGWGSEIGVGLLPGRATARVAAAPAAPAAVPSSSWRRVIGDMCSALHGAVGTRRARAEHVRSERGGIGGAGEPEMSRAVGTALGDAEHILEASQQRIVVVRRRVLHAGPDAPTDDDAADAPAARTENARQRAVRAGLLVAARGRVLAALVELRLVSRDHEQPVVLESRRRFDGRHPLRQELVDGREA